VRLAAQLLAVLVAVVGGAAPARGQRREEPQPHEWAADIDITVSELSNSALVAIQYTWTPESLNRFDEVVPALRRFVRHPSSLFARVRHDGNTIDTRSAVEAGGALHLIDGRIFVQAQGGVERDEVRYNFEDVYWAAPFTLEIGGRPHPLLALGLYYRGRPVLDASAGDEFLSASYRDGVEHELGGTVTGATPGDQLLASLSAGYYLADWEYTGTNPGPLDVKGWHAQARLSVQSSSTMSWTLSVKGRREAWDNGRLGEDISTLVGPDLERRVWAFEGDAGLLYWFKGKLGFHVTVGGGFETEPPIYYDNFRVGTRGMGRLGFGFVSRY
jgi:hypothetical protein